MLAVLITLIAVDLVFLTVSSVNGVMLETAESMRQHMTWGMVTACLLLFSHCLVLFYLIGSGTDVKETLKDHPRLEAKYVPWTRSLKRRAFPWGSLAVLLTLLAALLGGHVHSSLLLEGGPAAPPPVRQVSGWWVHLLFVLLAVGANAKAFLVELGVVRENRRVIDEINALLARDHPRSAPPDAA